MNNFNRLRILISIRFFAESLFFPFISLYLTKIGFTTGQIGIFLAAIPITSIICAPIYSIICKTPQQARIALTIMTILEPIFILIMINVKDFVPTLISLIFISIFSSSNYGLLDSLLALTCKSENKQFYTVRIFGSASYALGVLTSSLVIKYLNYETLFSLATILFFLSGFIYFFIKAPTSTMEKEKVSFKEIFSNKFFIAYMIFYILLIGSMQVADDFFSIYLKSKGSPDYIYSYVMVGFIAVEMVTMLTFKIWYKKFKDFSYVLAAAILVIRLIIQMLPMVSVPILIASQMLRGIVWGMALAINSLFIVKLLGFNKATRGIVIVSLGISIFTALFKLIGGYIIEAYSYSFFYAILAAIAFISFIYYIVFYLIYSKSFKKISVE